MSTKFSTTEAGGLAFAETGNFQAEGKPLKTRALLVFVCLIGVLLRIQAYLKAGPLFLDDAALAVNILQRPLVDLITQPLIYAQAAPRGFVVLESGMVSMFGPSELAFRGLPFLAGVAALPAFAVLAMSVLERRAAVLATFLFAASPILIHYGATVKPYTLDALIAIGILLGATRLKRPIPIWYYVACGLAAWFSLPSVFVVASVGIWDLATSVNRSESIRRLAPRVGLWLLIAAPALLLARDPVNLPFLEAYWATGFPPDAVGEALRWIVGLLPRLIRSPLMWDAPSLPAVGRLIATITVAALPGIGIWRITRLRDTRWAPVLTPIALVFIAALLRVYPFGGEIAYGGRALLFLVPSLLLLAAYGSTAFLGRPIGLLLPLALAMLALLPLAARAYLWRNPAIPSALAVVMSRRTADTRLYVHAGAAPVAEYYAKALGLPGNTVYSKANLHDSRRIAGELSQLDGDVWAVFSQDSEHLPNFLSVLDAKGRRIDQHFEHEATAVRYQIHPTGLVGVPIPTYRHGVD